MRPRRARRGEALLEFTLVGIPLIFVLISTVVMAYGMWNYDTLASCVTDSSRYAAVRGKNCACLTVDGMARRVAAYGIGLNPARLKVTLASATTTITCNPLTSCYGNTATWPPTIDAKPGNNIRVTAVYPLVTPVAMFWPGNAPVMFGAYNLGAASSQVILY